MINLSRFTKFTIALCWVMSLALSGCGITPPQDLLPVDVDDAAKARAWELKGKIAVKTDADNVSTNIYWLHGPDREELRLTSMLGTTVLLLTQDTRGAELELDGKQYQGRSAAELLERLSGWPLPLEELPLWITGQSHPDDSLTLDDAGRPELIEHKASGWQIRYQSWQQQSGAWVPRALSLLHPKSRIKIQINQWQALASPGQARPKTSPKEPSHG
ncbi:outer membrane lipoprotein LolB [Shewanella cyperi]|nr:outer membrane lipoprotein LolB [Shewanella cyperi]